MHYLRQILFFVFILLSGNAISQGYRFKVDSLKMRYSVDSLKTLIESGPDNELKLSRLLKLADKESVLNQEELFTILFRTKALAEKLKSYRSLALANRHLGMAYQNTGDFKTAIQFYSEAVDISRQHKLYGKLDNAAPAILNLYFYLGDYPNAMQVVMKELEIAEKRNDKRHVADAHNLLGYIYFKQEAFNDAEKYYRLYLDDAKLINDSTLMAHALGEIADLYIYQKKYTEAFNALKECIRISTTISRNIPFAPEPERAKVPQYYAKALYRLGRTHLRAGNLNSALENALSAVDFCNKNPCTKYDIASYYILAGEIFNAMQDYDKALNYLNIGFKLSSEILHRENIMEGAQYLSQTYESKKLYDSALFYFQLYTGIKDSIVNNETKMKIAGIQASYDLVKKDKQIARQKEWGYILVGSFAFILIILILLYNSYRLKARNKFQEEHNRQQNELFNVIVSTQEQERKRIAQDIHDSLGSVLSAARLNLSGLAQNKAMRTTEQSITYTTTLNLLDEAAEELRNISHNIMPATLSKLGIEAALKNLIDKISKHSGLSITFASHGINHRMEESMEISLYRIILELINNIVKHAAANKVSIQLVKYAHYINLTLEDDGIGFEKEKTLEEKKGIGLGNIRSRVEFMKGTMEIDSARGKGTTFIIEIPTT